MAKSTTRFSINSKSAGKQNRVGKSSKSQHPSTRETSNSNIEKRDNAGLIAVCVIGIFFELGPKLSLWTDVPRVRNFERGCLLLSPGKRIELHTAAKTKASKLPGTGRLTFDVLMFGASLDVGAWDLVLFISGGPATSRRRSKHISRSYFR
jgi:hypothetical protein